MSVVITLQGLDNVLAKLDPSRIEFHELLDGLSRTGQQQTQRRIEIEKTTPDGDAWPKTSDGRAALFVAGTNLYRSIDHAATSTQAIWGTGWIGARVHQFGAVIVPKNAQSLSFQIGGRNIFAKKVTIPARPYLGISTQNGVDLERAAARFIEGHLQ